LRFLFISCAISRFDRLRRGQQTGIEGRLSMISLFMISLPHRGCPRSRHFLPRTIDYQDLSFLFLQTDWSKPSAYGNVPQSARRGPAMVRVRIKAKPQARRTATARSKPERCPRLDRTGARCRSTVGSWTRGYRFSGGRQSERRNASCLLAGWQATRCRPGLPPA
jgi:hypothetical protein